MRRYFPLFLTIVLLATAIVHPTSGVRADSHATTRLRVGVVSDGIYRILPQDLANAGIDPGTVDPRTFAMSSLGLPVAIRVIGEADGRFDEGDAIEFFGEKFRGTQMEEKYTDERVYWLDIGVYRGLRIDDVSAAPAGDLTPPLDFSTMMRAEENKYWYALRTLQSDTKDTWYWERLQPPFGYGETITKTLSYTVPYPSPDTTALLRLEEHPVKCSACSWNHRTTVALAGELLIDQEWYGQNNRQLFEASLSSNLLRHGLNDVEVGATNIPDSAAAARPALSAEEALLEAHLDELWALSPDGYADDVYFNYWELEYRRLFRAWQGRIDFKVESEGDKEYEIDGWDTGDIAVWNITSPELPSRLSGALVQPQGSGYSLRFRSDAPEGDRFWLQETATIGRPASVRLRPPTGLLNPTAGADAIIITSAELMPAAEQLAQWHEDHGRRALVVDFQDIVDEFNDGIYNPRAVPDMLAWATTHWPKPAPRYVTLVGDGHWNFKGYNPDRYPPQPNHIPPFLAWVDPWQGEVPDDMLYSDIDGDRNPDIALGRLAVNTVEEAEAVVAKIVKYDESTRFEPWQRTAVFVADYDGVNNFAGLSDHIIADSLPNDITAQRIYLNDTVPDGAAARAAMVDALNSGALMLQYSGHGAPSWWSGERIWETAAVSSLENGATLPLVSTYNCLDGYFAHPDPRFFSIAETMQRYPTGGSIAAISPTGLGVTPDQHKFRSILMDVMFKQNVREVGESLLLTKQRYYEENGGPHYLVDTMTLFGDPAMRLPAPVGTTYLPLFIMD